MSYGNQTSGTSESALLIPLTYYQFKTAVDANISGVYYNASGQVVGRLAASVITAATNTTMGMMDGSIPATATLFVFTIDQDFQCDTGNWDADPITAANPWYPAGSGIEIGRSA